MKPDDLVGQVCLNTITRGQDKKIYEVILGYVNTRPDLYLIELIVLDDKGIHAVGVRSGRKGWPDLDAWYECDLYEWLG